MSDVTSRRRRLVGAPTFARFRPLFGIVAVVASASMAACSGGAEPPITESVGTTEKALTLTTASTPIGLAIEVDNGAGVPLKVRAGQTFYIEQVDIRASVNANVDEGVAGLTREGDFAQLPWGGAYVDSFDPQLLPDANGKFTRRRFYRGATWMNVPSVLTVEQIDANGNVVAKPAQTHNGVERQRRRNDDFFIRRLRAIQWTYDCVSITDCTGAQNFQEEALVELRRNMHPEETFAFRPETVALRVHWSTNATKKYVIPVEQVSSPTYDYGFKVEVEAVTQPGPGGVYAPGSDVTFRTTLMDGAGNRLHPKGSMPTYNQAMFGPNDTGIQYYRAFFDPTTTYYRRKNRERHMMAQIIGPRHKAQAIRSLVGFDEIFRPDGVQTIAKPERDGVYAEYVTFPRCNDLFIGPPGWDSPVSDEYTFHIPENAEPGTYSVVMKARRVFLGEDIPAAKTIDIQVGSPTPTVANLKTGPCNTCHSGESALGKVAHALDDRAVCAGCHAPLGFEFDAPIYVRAHFIHSRSGHFDKPLEKCSTCHLDSESTQRTSKSACLSCHKSYPQDHVDKFGPIVSSFVGGGAESFQTCTGSCHTTHPGSGL